MRDGRGYESRSSQPQGWWGIRQVCTGLEHAADKLLAATPAATTAPVTIAKPGWMASMTTCLPITPRFTRASTDGSPLAWATVKDRLGK